MNSLLTRRHFGKLLGAAAIRPLYAPEHRAVTHPPTQRFFYIAFIADTHIIDAFYRGPEGAIPEDTESIWKTSQRMLSARSVINSFRPRIDLTFLVGDYFHNYPSADYDFYFKNRTRLDEAKAITDGFHMPVHVGFGNHDYDINQVVSREMSHSLFKAKFGLSPYYAIDHKGWKFIHLNNFTGFTWDKNDPQFDMNRGSLGEEQLNWCEAQLAEGKPTFVLIHYPLVLVADTEFKDYGLYALLRKYRSNIQQVISGHWHRWIDFAYTYGPQHWVMASTRYDQNAYLIAEIDTQRQTHRFLNQRLIHWSTHYSEAFVPHREKL